MPGARPIMVNYTIKIRPDQRDRLRGMKGEASERVRTAIDRMLASPGDTPPELDATEELVVATVTRLLSQVPSTVASLMAGHE